MDSVLLGEILAVFMFLGVIVWPSLFSLIVAVAGSYAIAYAAVAAGAAGAGLLLLASPGPAAVTSEAP